MKTVRLDLLLTFTLIGMNMQAEKERELLPLGKVINTMTAGFLQVAVKIVDEIEKQSVGAPRTIRVLLGLGLLTPLATGGFYVAKKGVVQLWQSLKNMHNRWCHFEETGSFGKINPRKLPREAIKLILAYAATTYGGTVALFGTLAAIGSIFGGIS